MPTTYNPRYMKRWRHERSQGIKRQVSPERAMLHIASLRGAGWSIRAIAGACGLSPTQVSNISRNRNKTINRLTERALLSVTPDQVPSTASRQTTEPFVPRVGTVRRLQALLYMGWGWPQLIGHGIRPAVLHQQGRWVTRTVHDRVSKVYDELAMKQGPSPKAHTYAVQRGYLSPLAWDDIDLDPTPGTEEEVDDGDVDDVAVTMRMEGNKGVALNHAEQAELVKRWLVTGRSLAECDERTGLNTDRIIKRSTESEETE